MNYLATDYIGVTLIAKESVKAKTFASDIAPDFDNFVAGDIVGKIYSYVLRGASVWWMCQNANGTAYFIKQDSGLFEWSDSDNDIIRRNILNRGGDVTSFDNEKRNEKIKSWVYKGLGFLTLSYISKRVIDKYI
jgi:hypothetical protein